MQRMSLVLNADIFGAQESKIPECEIENSNSFKTAFCGKKINIHTTYTIPHNLTADIEVGKCCKIKYRRKRNQKI